MYPRERIKSGACHYQIHERCTRLVSSLGLRRPTRVRVSAAELPSHRIGGYFPLVASAPGKDCDFVSRFFDPGQPHRRIQPRVPICTFVPYFERTPGQETLHALHSLAEEAKSFCENQGEWPTHHSHILELLIYSIDTRERSVILGSSEEELSERDREQGNREI